MIYILLGAGFEEIEAVTVCDVLLRAGLDAVFAGVGETRVTGGHGIRIEAHMDAAVIDLDKAEMLVIPGGMGGVNTILGSEATLALIRQAHKRGIELAAICAGPTVFGKLGLLAGRRAVCYPGMEADMRACVMEAGSVSRDEGLTTGRGPGSSIAFALKLVEVLRGPEAAALVREALCYEG